MSRRLVPMLVLLALACGGGQAGSSPVAPAPKADAPDAAVRNFMEAVADSNIARMARYWGTRNGPAAETRQPADWEQRLGITQIFLRRSPYKIVRIDEVAGVPERRVVQVDLERKDADGTSCTRTIPVTVVDAKDHGWVVTAIDLSVAGTPGRACKPTTP